MYVMNQGYITVHIGPVAVFSRGTCRPAYQPTSLSWVLFPRDSCDGASRLNNYYQALYTYVKGLVNAPKGLAVY